MHTAKDRRGLILNTASPAGHGVLNGVSKMKGIFPLESGPVAILEPACSLQCLNEGHERCA